MNFVNCRSLLILTLVASGSLSAITPETDATVIENALLAMNNESADDSCIDPNDLLRKDYQTKLNRLKDYIGQAHYIEKQLACIPAKSVWLNDALFEDKITDIKIELQKMTKKEPFKYLMKVIETELDDALVDQLVDATKTFEKILEKCDGHFWRILPPSQYIFTSAQYHVDGFSDFRYKIEALRKSGFEGYLAKVQSLNAEIVGYVFALSQIDAETEQSKKTKTEYHHALNALYYLTDNRIVQAVLDRLIKDATAINLVDIFWQAMCLKLALENSISLTMDIFANDTEIFANFANQLEQKADTFDVELDADGLRPWSLGKMLKRFGCCKSKRKANKPA